MKAQITPSLSIISIIIIIFVAMTSFTKPESSNDKIMASGGELNFTVRTVTANGNYAPKHVLAIWVEYNNGFVKTRLLRGNARKQYLYTWKAASDYNVVDAITGATLTSHTTHSVSWDCLDLDGNIVPDGEYEIWVEFTDKHAQGPLYNLSFTKGPDAINLSPADETYFKDIELEFTPITSEFNSDVTEICLDGEVMFTDESVNATEWEWDFGDGASPAMASTPGPHIVSYATPGLKTVSLTINGTLIETKENYIEVFTNPIADFEFFGMDFTVEFSNLSTFATLYSWDFGDGTTSTDENPSHTYAGAGSYLVSLEAGNAACMDEITYEVLLPIVKVNEISQSNVLNIFPNPNNGLFTVDISGLSKVDEIIILDMAGRKTTFNKSQKKSVMIFDLMDIQGGIYLLQLYTSEKIYSKKIIVR